MPLATGDVLADGWSVEHLRADGSVRFGRSRAAVRRNAVSRLTVMVGCLAVCLALLGVSAQSADNLWLLTSSLIVLFGVTAQFALLAAVRDFRRAAVGVFLEVDVAARRVSGVVDGRGLLGQYRVRQASTTLSDVAFSLQPFTEQLEGPGALVVQAGGDRWLAPDLPRVEDGRALVTRLVAQAAR
jgi:hypothetical protein